jgi:hypothetical protein
MVRENLMIETEKILQKKISGRIIRRNVRPNKRIEKILEKVCRVINIEMPIILYCDTLTRRISSFEFRGIRYIIFDTSLFEFLFLYDKLIISDTNNDDVDKLFYKILYEECLFQDYPLVLPCYHMYKSKTFSFDDQFNEEANEYMAYQLHFLLLHEMAHFDFARNKNREDFLDFKEVLFRSFFIAVKENFISDVALYLKKGLLNFFGVDSDLVGRSDITWDDLSLIIEMEKMDALMEECFCDFRAFKYIYETFPNGKTEISASYSLLHLLIDSEFIRNSLGKDSITLNKEIDATAFMAILRIMMYELILSINEYEIEKELKSKCKKIFSRYLEVLEVVNSQPKKTIEANLKAMLIKMSREYMFGED